MSFNKKNIFYGLLLLISIILSFGFVSAWDFYGYVYDVNGTALYNVSLNATIWTMGGGAPTLVGSNSTYSYQNGSFSLEVTENSDWFYKPIIRHFEENKTDGSTAIDYVGQSLPWFPYAEFNGTTDINFYLREAGTINITALNRTGDITSFYYQVKDTKLNYPVEEEWNNMTSEAIVYVPRDRNYSIMVYPNQSMPVSYHWNNFSADSDYNITTANLSTYNHTTHTLQYQFNCSDNGVRVYGSIKNSSGESLGILNEFTVVPYLMEAGNVVYLEQAFPYNMSFGPGGSSDNYNLTSGFYNISLPGAAEVSSILLFATARNGTNYYGGFRNLTLNYSSPDTEINFTMYKLMSTDWNTSTSNITMSDFGGGNVNISTAKQAFNLVNGTNSAILENVTAHMEITVDYSDYNCTELTFTTDLSNEDGTFYLPLINATVKEINIYSNDYAPKRIDTVSVAEILTDFTNISLSPFNPGVIEGEEGEGVDDSDIFIELYHSNSTCDVPNPPDGCGIGAFGPSSEGYNQSRDNFSPLSVVMGGGALSFRMGYGNISVHYVNVDMLASGPPDMAFENDAGDSEITTSFENAIKFGSTGPTIYDYVLISLPYTEGSSSQTGLNEEEEVNISIPLFYDMDWNVTWNTAVNGTNGTLLAGNYSHYSAHSSDWEALMGNNTCITNVSNFNATNPCYINTDNNQIWIRLPHFSGTAPTITGYLLTAATTEEEEDTGRGSSSSTASFWTSTYILSEEELQKLKKEGFTKELSAKHRIKMKLNESDHYVGVVLLTEAIATINVSSTPQQATLQAGDERRFEVTGDAVYDLSVKLNSINSTSEKADLTIKAISEEVTAETEAEEQEKEAAARGIASEGKNKTGIIIIVVLILVVLIGAGIIKKKSK